ncbi:hypothetical protein Srot_0069 [Segniliparus rotundus DSM 44985]|uniref:Head-to-tail stopper n=1 Tax=Segniliparus rotundus (strain ATCC BAA-972 / CDC 1076 / CIP 108378 / DSM 44985 / JCM 13578) TaxID=640132 RepID=D6Z9N5_SEGRD|nr:hypothetical protein [Segniliparus rotundus]ADG96562.1 hypothetical protein Srot_0069 [Segniliparus rotundus DSM 44985]
MSLPQPHTVQHRRKTKGGYDDQGYQIEPGFSEPVERRVIAVYWERPAEAVVGDSPERDRDELVVLTGEPEAYGDGDLIEAAGLQYRVIGPRDWRMGPFGFKPGGEVRCVRRDG